MLVSDNQAVRRGDPMVRIDAQEYDARLAAAEAGVADAVAGVATARAALAALGADESLAAARVRELCERTATVWEGVRRRG